MKKDKLIVNWELPNKRVYLSQSVPVCDRLTRVSQHLVPMVPSETLSVWPSAAHTDYLIVSNTLIGKRYMQTDSQKPTFDIQVVLSIM